MGITGIGVTRAAAPLALEGAESPAPRLSVTPAFPGCFWEILVCWAGKIKCLKPYLDETDPSWTTTKLCFTGVFGGNGPFELQPLPASLTPHLLPGSHRRAAFALFLPVLMLGREVNEVFSVGWLAPVLLCPQHVENWIYSCLEKQRSPSFLLRLFPDFSEGFLEVLLSRFLTVSEQPVHGSVPSPGHRSPVHHLVPTFYCL